MSRHKTSSRVEGHNWIKKGEHSVCQFMSNRSTNIQMKMKNFCTIKKPSTVYEAIRPIFWYYKILGLLPFSCDASAKGEKFKSEEIDKVWLFLVLCFHSYVFWNLSASFRDFKTADASVLIAIGWLICMLWQIAIVVLSTFNLLFKMEKFEEFLDILDEFDRQVIKTL